MIPLRDTIPSKTFPVVNSSLIALNILVYLIQLTQNEHIDHFILIYGLVPARYSIDYFANFFSLKLQILSFFSFMFLHGNWLHLISNMWSLYIFGDNVEDHLGPFRYLIFYILCGIASGTAYLLSNYYSKIPVIGASGAIAGVMGAYFVIFPHAKVLTFFLIVFIPMLVEIPAFWFLGFWFLLQIFNATSSQGQLSGIAWWAHVGGFVFGMFLLRFFSAIPSSGFSNKVQSITQKKKSHRLQVIHPQSPFNDANIYGTLKISPFEASSGTSKLINISLGIQTKFYKVVVPEGIAEGQILRLKGIGRRISKTEKGDLLLKILFES